jgi:hypothetical protein
MLAACGVPESLVGVRCFTASVVKYGGSLALEVNLCTWGTVSGSHSVLLRVLTKLEQEYKFNMGIGCRLLA